jgi:hypothetical protein
MGRFKMRYDFYHNRIVDEKAFNKLKWEEMKRKNPVINELAINLMLQQEDEV